MTLVSDYDDPHLGPAWFFQVNYDKVVILPEETFTAPTSKVRRQVEGVVEEVEDEATATDSPAGSTPTPTTPDNALPSSTSAGATGTASPSSSAPATNNLSGGSSDGSWVPPPHHRRVSAPQPRVRGFNSLVLLLERHVAGGVCVSQCYV